MAGERILFGGQTAALILLCCIRAHGISAPPSDVSSPPPASGRSPAAAYQQALKQLTDEARESWKDQKLVRAAPNFAADFTESIPAEYLAQKIARRLHEDPFHDAYIRWQLTSLPGAVVSASLTDRRFESLLRDLPALLENPRSERDTVNALVRTTDAGELSEPQQQRAAKHMADLAARAERIAALNQPAIAFRTWLGTQVRDSKHRSILAAIEVCAATVDAGWPSDAVKTALEELLTAAGDDKNLSTAQRQTIVAKLHALAGRHRVIIVHATLQDARMYAQYADTAILDFDVRRWCRLIQLE